MVKGLHHDLIQFIKANGLIVPGDRVLIAVSGGIDSIVLLHLLARTGYADGVAHCNFTLRGKESDEDEELVINTAKSLDLPVYVKRFNTADYARDNKLSIQMAARELRYGWFSDVMKEEKYNKLATAHHLDDNAETILLNLAKGSVIEGLRGIEMVNGNIIRPMISFSKHQINDYATLNNLAWREDASNQSDKYQRNLIRNKIIPLLEQINPDLAKTLYKTSRIRAEIFTRWQDTCKQTWDQIVSTDDRGRLVISKKDWKNYGVDSALAYSLLKPYGFTYSQVQNLEETISGGEPKFFHSEKYRLVSERNKVIIESLKENGVPSEILIPGPSGEYYWHETRFDFRIQARKEIKDLRDGKSAFLDLSKLSFPLTIRKWKPGDKFIPFGMTGQKLVSDYLTDRKVGYSDKESQTVIITADHKICWLVGRRTDNRFKIGDETEKVLTIRVDR